MATYLKPGPERGSVEHFYHFVLQYLLPLFELDLTNGVGGKGFVVRDCGPMNVWFDYVFGPEAFAISPREEFDKKSSGRFWDKPIQLTSFARKKELLIDPVRFNEVLAAFRQKFLPPSMRPDLVTVLDRRPPPAFYVDGRAENEGGGSSRRSIDNLQQLSQNIAVKRASHLVDFWGITPAEQLETISQTSALIGQHGAGLVHLLFLDEDAIVVELRRNVPDERHFETLATGLSRPYYPFFIEGEHATLSEGMIAEISEFVANRT